MPRKKRPRRTRRPSAPDGLESYAEWLDHQYDPAYYTGGRAHPLYVRPGRRGGWALVATGVITVALAVLAAVPGSSGHTGWLYAALGCLFGGLLTVGGVRVIRRSAPSS